MPRPTLVPLLCSLWLLPASASASHVFHIPPGVSNASSNIAFTSGGAAGLDAPKLHPVNASAFEWWYFDAVASAPGSLASVAVTFLTTSPTAFPLLAPGSGSESVTRVQLAGSFADGTAFGATVSADGATVTTGDGDGDADSSSSGTWHNSGFRWTTQGQGRARYTIEVDAPAIGVRGTISLRSVAPAHYACGPARAGEDMQVGPGVGWANAVPDAEALVQLWVNGTSLAFAGLGYHDKNWGTGFPAHVARWFWGHGRLGGYSVVWFAFVARDGREYGSVYVAEGGRVVAASCKPRSVRVRPTISSSSLSPSPSQNGTASQNDTSASPVGSSQNDSTTHPQPTGYHIALELGRAGTLEMELSVARMVVDEPGGVYRRGVAEMKGRVVRRREYPDFESSRDSFESAHASEQAHDFESGQAHDSASSRDSFESERVHGSDSASEQVDGREMKGRALFDQFELGG